MKAGRASIRYAKALLEFAIENQKEKAVVEEMQNILSVVESSPELDDALNSPVLPGSQKRKIIDGVFPKASKLFKTFLTCYHKKVAKGFLGE
jgi:F-type H+-transporting ATPase subunit delta